MREIRTRVSERHGIELSNQQIQELAARRLEAILDPRAIKPALMDELRRAAGLPPDSPPPAPPADPVFDESALYESPSGLVRLVRRLLNPLLKLLINPQAISDAITAQTRLNQAATLREADYRRRQAEWNALHFEILRRLVTDIARTEIDAQHLGQRVESLSAKVDFNERRVRGLEQTQHHARPHNRSPEAVQPATAASAVPPREPPPPREDAGPRELPPPDGAGDAGRRKRRRRRGRRSGGGQLRDGLGAPVPSAAGGPAVDQTAGSGDLGEDDDARELSAVEPEENSSTSVVEQPAPALDSTTSVEPGEQRAAEQRSGGDESGEQLTERVETGGQGPETG
jgi:hypothetical protein